MLMIFLTVRLYVFCKCDKIYIGYRIKYRGTHGNLRLGRACKTYRPRAYMQCSGNQESPAFRHGECQLEVWAAVEKGILDLANRICYNSSS